MIEMNTYEKGSLAGFFYGNLVRYRAIPAMYALTKRGRSEDAWNTELDKALEGLKSALRILEFRRLSDEDILEMIDAHKNWIRYTFYDMAYYFNKLVYHFDMPNEEVERMEYYLPAMAEIVNSPLIDWRMGTFDCGVEHPTILDVGCGNMPFMKLFRRDNKGNIWYYGLDKRKPTDFPIFRSTLPKITEMGISEWLSSKAFHIIKWRHGINTVFFGNFLHCMQEPAKLLEKVAKLPNVTKIMVVEFAPKSALNFMFDFHMYIHAGTSTITEPLCIDGWIGELSYPTTQHQMVTYTKK